MKSKQIQMQFEFLDCYRNLFFPTMARKSSKCLPTVEPNQIGCVWNFGGVFDHRRHRRGLHHLLLNHGSPHQQLLSDESWRSQCLPGAGDDKSHARMLTFDEQLSRINKELKKKTADVKDEFWKKTMEKSFWKKIKSRYENANKKKENTSFVECPVDIGCQCLFAVNNVRGRMKNSKKLKSFRKVKSCYGSDENGSETEKLSLVPFYKHQEPEIFVEARRHLAERLRLVVMGAGAGAGVSAGEPLGSVCEQVPRTLERVLLSSPIHESMAGFECGPDGACGEKSLQKVRCGSSPLKHGVYSSASGFVEIKDTNDQFKENQNPSPVSVLDFFFSDNIDSPTNTYEFVEHQIPPRRLDFEQQSTQASSSRLKTGLSLFADDPGPRFVSSYENDIYRIADHKVVHDCIKEMLVGSHSKIPFFSSKIRPFSLETDVINKVIDLVDWHNGQPAGSRTLDHFVRWDMANYGPWLDTSVDKDDVVFEVVDETLVELIIEVIHDICL